MKPSCAEQSEIQVGPLAGGAGCGTPRARVQPLEVGRVPLDLGDSRGCEKSLGALQEESEGVLEL